MSDHVILDSNTHRDLRVQTAAGEEYGDAVMSALVVPEEFRQVQAYYPIVFRKDLERGAFAALALFGFEKGENLYLDGNQWDARYKPLAAAIKPFLVGRAADGEGPGQVHIDMRHPRVTARAFACSTITGSRRPIWKTWPRSSAGSTQATALQSTSSPRSSGTSFSSRSRSK